GTVRRQAEGPGSRQAVHTEYRSRARAGHGRQRSGSEAMIRPFRVLTPTTVPEAAAELERLGDAARIYAGGAELLLLMRHGLLEPEYLVNIKKVGGLDAIAWDENVLGIGAQGEPRP